MPRMRILRLAFVVLLPLLLPPAFAQQRIVTMATTDWPPYYSQNLPGGGHVTEITREAFKRVGYQLDVTWMPWKRAQLEVKDGRFMGLLGAYKTAEREGYALYNKDPISVALTGIFTTEDKDIDAQNLNDLEGYTIGLLRGTSISREFDEADLGKYFVNSEESVLGMLEAGRVDAIAGDYYVFQSVLESRNTNLPLKTVIILSNENIYNAFSRQVEGYEALMRDFDRGLELIKSDGTYDRILNTPIAEAIPGQ